MYISRLSAVLTPAASAHHKLGSYCWEEKKKSFVFLGHSGLWNASITAILRVVKVGLMV